MHTNHDKFSTISLLPDRSFYFYVEDEFSDFFKIQNNASVDQSIQDTNLLYIYNLTSPGKFDFVIVLNFPTLFVKFIYYLFYVEFYKINFEVNTM